MSKDVNKVEIGLYDKDVRYKNIIEYKILDENGNIVEEKRIENTDTLIARCVVWNNPASYLTCAIVSQDPREVLGLGSLDDVYKYFKVNYMALKKFDLFATSSFSNVDSNSISTFLTYSNNTAETYYIYFVCSYYDNKNVLFTYYLFDTPIELLPNYTLQLKYYIYIEKYMTYASPNLTSNKYTKDNTNDIIENVDCDSITREYKYSRSFIKTKPYLGLDTDDYSSTVSAPKFEITGNSSENKSNILSYNNEYDEYYTYELYLRFLEDGNVGNTNAMLFGVHYLYNYIKYGWYVDWCEDIVIFDSLFYTDKFKNKEKLCYDPNIINYTNSYIIYSDGEQKRIKTGHYDPTNGKFTETRENIPLKPLKRSIIDFPLVDGINTLKEWFKLVCSCVQGYFSDSVGLGGGYYSYLKNIWLTIFYSNIDKQLKYYLHWDENETDPYFYIVTSDEISQIEFNGTIIDKSNITPFYYENIELSNPKPSGMTNDDFYIYKIHLSEYIDITTNNPCKVIISFTEQPHIVFCYKSNCYVYAIECDENLVNTSDSDVEDTLICRSVLKCRGISDKFHKIKQYHKNYADNYVANLISDSIIYQIPKNHCIIEVPQLCFNSIIFNNTKLVANNIVKIIDNSNIEKFNIYYPVGNIIKQINNDIVHIFGHTYWNFHIEYPINNYSQNELNKNTLFYSICDIFINSISGFGNISIILPFLFPSYTGINYYLYENGAYPQMYSDRLKNFDVSACRNEIETLTIDLFGEQFKMCIPIETETKIGQLTINFQNADVSPTFVEGEFIGIPCCNKWLITDSLEKWVVFENISNVPETSPYKDYLEDYTGEVGWYALQIRSDSLPDLTDLVRDTSYREEFTCAPVFEIEIPDEIHNKWNTMYYDKNGLLKYRIVYFVEDFKKWNQDYDRRSTISVILFFPQYIQTSNGIKQLIPELILLNNTEEVPFSYSFNPDVEKLDGIGYINVHIHKYRFWDSIYWRQKNNFILYVYFKEADETNKPFIRDFEQKLPPTKITIEGLQSNRYGGNKYKLSPYVYWHENHNTEDSYICYSYPITFEERDYTPNIEIRDNVFRWTGIQLPAFMKLIDPIIICNFGDDEKTLYEHFNVNSSDTNNQIVPKTFYLDAKDFGENIYECLQNTRDNIIEKEILIYFGWAYEPENRNGNDLTTIYPIIKVDKIRQIFGDNFKITDINGNELEWWFVTGEEFYTDTHTISTTPTNYIMINRLGRTPRNYNSDYIDTRGENYTDDSHYQNNIIMSFSYNWDWKNRYDFIYKESGWRDNLNIQPYKYWDYDIGNEEIFYNAPNFRIGDNNYNMHRNKNPEIIFSVCPESCFHNSNSPSYWVGKPYPIPGFIPSFWLDYIIRHNKPNIALDVIRVVSGTPNNQTTTPSINGKIVDSQFEIEKPDITGRIKIYEQVNKKLVKQDVKYIYSVAVHEFNKHYIYRGHPNHGWSHKVVDNHKVRYFIKVETGMETKIYYYDKILNEWKEITDKFINNIEEVFNLGFDKFDLEMYGHKLNDLLRNYMNDTDTLSFIIAMKNEAPIVSTSNGTVNIDDTQKDEYAFIEIWGISIEAEFNNDSYYIEIPWCWIDINTKDLLIDISGKAQNEITTAIKCVPTHWIKWDITNTSTPDNTIFKDSKRFYQLPLRIYLYNSSFKETNGYTLKFSYGFDYQNTWIFIDNYKDDYLLRDDTKI